MRTSEGDRTCTSCLPDPEMRNVTSSEEFQIAIKGYGCSTASEDADKGRPVHSIFRFSDEAARGRPDASAANLLHPKMNHKGEAFDESKSRRALRKLLQAYEDDYVPSSAKVHEATLEMPRAMEAPTRDCGTGGAASCMFAACYGCDDGVPVSAADIQFFRNTMFKLLVAVNAHASDLYDAGHRSSSEPMRSMQDCGAWSDVNHLRYVSVLLGAAVNYWPQIERHGKQLVMCKPDNNYFERPRSEEYRCHKQCCPSAQYRYGLYVDPNFGIDTTQLNVEVLPNGATRTLDTSRVRTDEEMHLALLTNTSHGNLAQFNMREAINVVHQIIEGHEAQSSELRSGRPSTIVGVHFVMLVLQPEPSKVHSPAVLKPRLKLAAAWLRANTKYLNLLARCLQLLYPKRFPENAYRDENEPLENNSNFNLRDVLLVIVARDMYRREETYEAPGDAPAPEWLEYIEEAKEEAWPSALENCWYALFVRIRDFSKKYGALVEEWVSTQANAISRKERGTPLKDAPKERPRRCRGKATAEARKWCLTCRILIYINAAFFKFEPPKLKGCNVRAFFEKHGISPSALHPSEQMRPSLDKGFTSLFQYPHSVSLHFETGRILTAAWVPSKYTEKRTVLDLLQAKYRTVPPEAWEGMCIKSSYNGDILKLKLNDFPEEPRDYQIIPTCVGFAIGDSLRWIALDSERETLATAYYRATSSTAPRNTRPELRLTESFSPAQGWRTRAHKALGYIVTAKASTPPVAASRARKPARTPNETEASTTPSAASRARKPARKPARTPEGAKGSTTPAAASRARKPAAASRARKPARTPEETKASRARKPAARTSKETETSLKGHKSPKEAKAELSARKTRTAPDASRAIKTSAERKYATEKPSPAHMLSTAARISAEGPLFARAEISRRVNKKTSPLLYSAREA